VFSRAQILEDELDTVLAERRREHSLGARRDREIVGRAQKDLLGIEKQKADRGIASAERIRKALEIRAPHEGIVLFGTDSNGRLPRVGEPAWSGEVMARIPSLDAVEAEVFVLEADAGGLAVGSPATVVVEAAPDEVYSARVKRVDSLPKPRNSEVPVQYFQVSLELDRFDGRFMKPGQRVQSTIVLEDLVDVLVVPRQAVFDRGGRFCAYRRRSGVFDAVSVRTGSASASQVIVVEGLAEGDLVALRDPTRTLEEILPAGATPAPGAQARP
jgi:HlyD family secretion protein